MRRELEAIGKALIVTAIEDGPLNLTAIGQLLKRLAVAYGRIVNDGRRTR